MANPSDSLQRNLGYFHSGSKTLVREGQAIYETPYAAGHVITLKDVIGENLPYFPDQASLDTFLTSPETSGVLTKYDNVSMTEVKSVITGNPDTDQQSWYLDDGGQWMKPIVFGVFAPDPVTNKPSSILDPVLYKDNGDIVPGSMGVWWVDPFQGLLRFGAGYEPYRTAPYGGTAIGTPHLTCYVYTGPTLENKLAAQVEGREYVYIADSSALTHTIDHNLGTYSLNCSIFEPGETSGWSEIWATPEHLTPNQTRITLTEPLQIRATFRKIG